MREAAKLRLPAKPQPTKKPALLQEPAFLWVAAALFAAERVAYIQLEVAVFSVAS